ncbi:MAG: hypothetical protein ABSG31_05785 [Tepidisphaeraceae bacterium]
MAQPILEYDTPRSPPRKLTLEEADGYVRVLFAVAPKWVCLLPIVMAFTVGLIRAATGVYVVGTFWHIVYATGRVGQPNPTPEMIAENRHFAVEVLSITLLEATFWWAAAAFNLWKYRRWGRVPRILTASHESLVFTRLGWWRMRERIWLPKDITEIEYRPVKRNLNRWRTVGDLFIHRQKGWRVHFRLSSADPELPRLIATRLATALDCPLKGQSNGH